MLERDTICTFRIVLDRLSGGLPGEEDQPPGLTPSSVKQRERIVQRALEPVAISNRDLDRTADAEEVTNFSTGCPPLPQRAMACQVVLVSRREEIPCQEGKRRIPTEISVLRNKIIFVVPAGHWGPFSDCDLRGST